MARGYERTHPHLDGMMIAAVTEEEDSPCEVKISCFHRDGRVVVIALGAYPTCAVAQRKADEHVQRLHECSAQCEPWARPVTH